MPLPNVSSSPIRGEVTPQNFQDIQDPRSIPGFGSATSADIRSGPGAAVLQSQTAPDPLSLQLRRELEGIIGQGGVGLSPEQLDVQFRGVEQQLQPQFNTQLQRIDEQASRRGVFRSGIPLQQAQKTQRQQAQQLGQIRTQLTTENERQKNQTLLTALNMLRSLESDLANRELYLKALDELKKSQDQAGYQALLGQFGSFALNRIFPETQALGLLPGISPGSPNAPFPTTGGIT